MIYCRLGILQVEVAHSWTCTVHVSLGITFIWDDFLLRTTVHSSVFTFCVIIDGHWLFISISLLRGGSKGVINSPWIFYCNAEFSPCWTLLEYVSGHLFTCGSFQWGHGLLFTVCIVWDDKDKVIGFKRSHWIHLRWLSTGSPKLQLF